MDLVMRRHMIYVSLSESESISPNPGTDHAHSSSGTSFPIIAIAIIGIMATAFLLVSYYIFVIKCCLNWHRIDILRRFSPSRRRGGSDDPALAVYSSGIQAEPRGLDEAVIRLIPVIGYKNSQHSSCECAVCLNEFQEHDKLRIIPNCSHVFHIDCIDVWLQNNANCPLCRTSISLTSRFSIHQLLTPPTIYSSSPPSSSSSSSSSSPQQLIEDEDFVVIELGDERVRGLESSPLPRTCSVVSSSPRKKGMKLKKVTSMGDECIDMRGNKDENFSVQPIRRSFSMDSSGDRKFYLAVQEALKQQQQQQQQHNNTIEGCSGGSASGRAKRSFFSFGYGSGRSRSSVLPVLLDS
ncbi:RING-H2 finger protein ATL16 [Arachis stenosperma]|uniref:RING-H2 finger protein ATL16 n=1 Tax=Arachis stenosperma TaxID=217475 RepID=UPI0025AC01B9|nr:RING-H2 finger protein ATL16 [Arachis stenosperma]